MSGFQSHIVNFDFFLTHPWACMQLVEVEFELN